MSVVTRSEITFDREDDGRWIAEIAALPGCLAYGATQEEAAAAVEALAQRIREQSSPTLTEQEAAGQLRLGELFGLVDFAPGFDTDRGRWPTQG